MKNKKIMCTIVALLLCFAILSGCSTDSNQPSAQPSVGTESEKLIEPKSDTQPSAAADISFSEQLLESEGEIFVEGSELNIILNIDRADTDYWEYSIVEGADILTELENNPPGKIAQYGHSWIFEAKNPGAAVMEFVLYNENNRTKGNGYRFTFYVDDSLSISSDTEYSDLTEDNTSIGPNDGAEELFITVAEEVFESVVSTMELSPYTYNLLGEDVNVYYITCENGKSCDMAQTADGTVFINENDDTPDFKYVTLGNYIIIGKAVNDYHDSIDYMGFAQSVINDLLQEPGTIVEVNNELAEIFVDHREVRVYGVAYEFDVAELIAIDETTANIYIDTYGSGEFNRVIYNPETGQYGVGEQVTVFPWM
jgi:hypothetical protein